MYILFTVLYHVIVISNNDCSYVSFYWPITWSWTLSLPRLMVSQENRWLSPSSSPSHKGSVLPSIAVGLGRETLWWLCPRIWWNIRCVCLALCTWVVFWPPATHSTLQVGLNYGRNHIRNSQHFVSGIKRNQRSGIILWMRPTNERRRYSVTPSLIGWAHTQNDPWEN